MKTLKFWGMLFEGQKRLTDFFRLNTSEEPPSTEEE